MRDFLLGEPNLCSERRADEFTIKFLSQDRFVLSPKDNASGFAVLFLPAEHKSAIPSAVLKQRVNVFTAPGVSEELENLTGLAGVKSAYLHHNLQSAFPVFIDVSFPVDYLPQLKQALSKWNSTLGINFFEIQDATLAQLDVLDCLSSRKLCIFWDGPKYLSFLGATGMTQITFDPESGEIIGGYIGIANSAVTTTSLDISSPLIARFLDEKTSLLDIAQLYSMRETLKDYLHPAPLWDLAYVFSHELGHFNGLSHNFYGDNSGPSFRRQASVMDYLPFTGVNSQSGDLGTFDQEMVNLVYKDKSPSINYRFCSDFEAALDGISKNPNCNQFDLGSSEQWFIALAEVSSDGVFAPHPRFSGILLDYLGAFLIEGKTSVSSEQKINVSTYLCKKNEKDNRILKYTKDKLQLDLVCPK